MITPEFGFPFQSKWSIAEREANPRWQLRQRGDIYTVSEDGESSAELTVDQKHIFTFYIGESGIVFLNIFKGSDKTVYFIGCKECQAESNMKQMCVSSLTSVSTTSNKNWSNCTSRIQ